MDVEKLKKKRSRQGGWLTRTIDLFEENKDSPAVLQFIVERVSTQLKKLQSAHDTYVEALEEDNEIDEADDWMSGYIDKASKCLREIEDRILTIKTEQASAIAERFAEPPTSDSLPTSLDQLPGTSSMSPSVASPQQLIPSTSEGTINNTAADPQSRSSSNPSPGTSGQSSIGQSPTVSASTAPSANVVSSQSSDASRETARQATLNADDIQQSSSTNMTNIQDKNSIDSWIDDLVVGVATTNISQPSSTDFGEAIVKLQIERDLPAVQLPVFDGSPLLWPQFVEQFHVQVHCRPYLDDTRRMDLLQSHVKGEAKKIILGLGYSGRNYALALKELKFAFGHRISVARAYLDMITVGNILPSGDPHALRNFYVAIRDCIATLRQMSYTSELTSMDVLQRTTRRIPGDKRGKWNDCVRNICRVREPNLVDFEKWLKECIESEFNPFAVSVRPKHFPQATTASPTHKYHTTLNTSMTTRAEPRHNSCLLCSQDHALYKCPDYLVKTAEERYDIVKRHHLCFNCLHSNHRIADCKSRGSCKANGCKIKHHTTLHRPRPSTNTQYSTATAFVNNTHREFNQVYFQVMPVVVHGKNGRTIDTYALLDSCSDITLINNELADDLGLHGKPECLTLNTLSSPVSITSSRVSLSVRAQRDPDAPSLWIKEAWTRPGVFRCPPIQECDFQHMPHLRQLGLCDIAPNDVKILIGANVPKAHLQMDSREGLTDGPIAVRTVLGWCIIGASSRKLQDSVQANVNFVMSQDMQLQEQVEKFWSTESFGVAASLTRPTSVEDQRSKEILKVGTIHLNGHYQVPMLWRNEDKAMPDNRVMAERRLSSLLKRLSTKPDMKEKYNAVMDGYIHNGYARRLTAEEERLRSKKTWYLPHHYVTNPNKPNKLRVVFDAAAKVNDISLNTSLMTGPDLTNNLFTVLQHFRLHPVAVVADITEMFHQVRVTPSDSDALRFLWKSDVNSPDPPQAYKMLVHIFGAKDSPCCVNYALRQVASAHDVDEDVRSTILQNFYVDDMLKSVKDVPTAIALVNRITHVLSDKGFRLAKWMTSSEEVMRHINQSTTFTSTELDLDLENLPTQRVLGLGWNVKEDSFLFKPSIQSEVMTKRMIISTVSSIYDPCGFLAPFTFRAKCIIQEAWREGIDWDETVTDELQRKWRGWIMELKQLSSFRIPRYHGTTDGMTLELHTFSDASELGFSAVTYLRMLDSNGIRCSFLAARSHVAPLKQTLTIPKLELQGAVMAVRLACTLKDTFPGADVTFWTDSITVLRYITNESRRWKIFVANRVTEIREHSEPNQWKYVPSAQNAADDATRGLPAAILCQANRWILGPSFLWRTDDNWPSQPEIQPPKEDDEGLRKTAACLNTSVKLEQATLHYSLGKVIQPDRYSSWYKACRVTAWVVRALWNFRAGISSRGTTPTKDKNLCASEIYNAEICLARIAQQECFPREYRALQQGSQLKDKSPILSLHPFFDPSCSIIRLGGRIRKAAVEEDVKHQIMLPYDHHVTKLIAKSVHVRQAHCGPEHLIATLRQRFWAIKCRQLAKKIIHQCLDCHRRSVQPAIPLMADLPAKRISGYSRPFLFTGLDYFGPMLVKRARSRLKKWGCIFTCLVTRAVHLELVDSLQTDDFLLVLRCFVSRRGWPKELFSDNATTFKGAERELKNSLQELDQSRINDFFLQGLTKWNFIPPHAPHFGGAWERLVRSVKTALKAVLQEQVVTESVLRTTLAEVEAVLNSRPLTYNSSSVDDYTVLTPNHFLHGDVSSVTPPGEFHPSEVDSRKRWRQCQVLADHVWRRWSKEYLPSLTVRNKWKAECRNLQIDDVVILVEHNLPRGQWLLGRITEVHSSDDGRVRSASIKTSQGTYVRPTSKICVLEEGLK